MDRPKYAIRFGVMHPDGHFEDMGYLNRDWIKKCPHNIFAPDHYHEDGKCRCDDPTHFAMLEWEYTWDEKAKRWL